MARILIVEDDAAQRTLYEVEISEMGYEVVLAKDGREAMEKFCRKKPDAVVLDLKLPGMQGSEILRKLLAVNPAIPVIIHTASVDYREDAIRWAAEAYIVKSSDLSELKSAIKRVLS